MIDIQANKLDAIKAVREYCNQTFGVFAGLRETIAFLDSLNRLQEPASLRARFEIVGSELKPEGE